MKYLAQFCKQWVGTWKFEALNDKRAWEIAWKYIRDHTSVVIVGIEAIYEIDDAGEIIREIPRG